MTENKTQKVECYIIWLAWIGIFAARLWLFPDKSDFNTKGLMTWVNILILSILFIYLLLTALGLGRIILRRFETTLTPLEFNLLALMLGLATLSLIIFTIGLIGWLNKLSIFSVLAATGLISQQELEEFRSTAGLKIKFFKLPPARNLYEILLQIILMTLLPLLFLNALTPVWDYDALNYHLEVPRQFLEHGKIFFNPEAFRSAFPILGEMLFIVGLGFKLDSLAKLIHLTYAILLILGAYTFGKRFFGYEATLIAIGILVGTTSIPAWATWVSMDFAWAGYEFWSLYLITLWLTDEKKNNYQTLMLAGILSGFAASTKYLSMSTMLIVGAIIIWQSLRNFHLSILSSLKNLMIYGVSAVLIMAPWYIKNWIWTGNPIYPLIWGGPGWDPVTAQVFNEYLHTFGVGTRWIDYLLIPYNVYANHTQFSTTQLEIIHPAIWLAFAYPLLKQPPKKSFLFFYSGAYLIIWAINSQVIRFLLPSFAVLSILAGDVIQKFPPLVKKITTTGLLGSFLLISLIYQVLLVQSSFGYLSGQKTKGDFLTASVNYFPMAQHIQEVLLPDERAQFLWNGRGYYCDTRCIPDDEQAAAVRLAASSPFPQSLSHNLRAKGITHIMLSYEDAIWFIDYHDPHQYHQQALDYFDNVFLPACGKLLYTKNKMTLYQITCP